MKTRKHLLHFSYLKPGIDIMNATADDWESRQEEVELPILECEVCKCELVPDEIRGYQMDSWFGRFYYPIICDLCREESPTEAQKEALAPTSIALVEPTKS